MISVISNQFEKYSSDGALRGASIGVNSNDEIVQLDKLLVRSQEIQRNLARDVRRQWGDFRIYHLLPHGGDEGEANGKVVRGRNSRNTFKTCDPTTAIRNQPATVIGSSYVVVHWRAYM